MAETQGHPPLRCLRPSEGCRFFEVGDFPAERIHHCVERVARHFVVTQTTCFGTNISRSEVDPLVCAGCDGRMKIIAVIERPVVIRQIRSAEPSSRAQAEGLATKPVVDDLPGPDPAIA